MSRKLFGVAVVIGVLAVAQYVPRNLSQNLGSGALPGSCTTGDVVFRTDPATTGQNIYGCTSANTWTLQGDGTGGGGAAATGTWAAKPGTCKDGDLYLPNDTGQLLRCASNTWIGWGLLSPFTEPVLGDYAWVNQGAATTDTTFGGIFIEAPIAAGTSLRILKKSAPSTPYTITAVFRPQLYAFNNHQTGLLFRQSSDGKVVSYSLVYAAQWRMYTQKYTNATTFSADYLMRAVVYLPQTVWLRIEDDGANRISSWSMNGAYWTQFHSVGRTDFLTADEVGFFVNDGSGAVQPAALLMSWVEE